MRGMARGFPPVYVDAGGLTAGVIFWVRYPMIPHAWDGDLEAW